MSLSVKKMIKNKKKICMVTGSRAEYGVLKLLMSKIKNDVDLTLQIIATGMHLSPEFGLTFNKIISDGFKIDEKIEMLLSSDTNIGISKSIGIGIIGFAEAYARLKPDIIIITADRFEMLAATIPAMLAGLPIAHIDGGELTLGAYDDYIRNSITKMSLLHFTCNEDARKRIIQMGENPNRVANIGALALDSIKNLKLFSKEELYKKLNIPFNKINVLITFHPATLEKNSAEKQFSELLFTLHKLKNATLIFTKANADTDGRVINEMINNYVANNFSNAIAFHSLGSELYISILKIVDFVIGNSSSGIIEVPFFKIPTINIGDRQRGRLQPDSVINCKPFQKDISYAIKVALSNEFRTSIKKIKNPYYKPNSADRIKEFLKKYDFKKVQKEFYEIEYEL